MPTVPPNNQPIGSGNGYGASTWTTGGQGLSGSNLGIYNASNPQAGAAVQSAWINANNATGQQEQLAGQMGNQIGYYQGMQAPTMKGAQLGAAPTSNAAQNGASYNQMYSGNTNLGPTAYSQAATINQGMSNQDRGLQMQNINALQTQAAGGGPSVAAQQAQASSQAAIAGQMAAAASQRGSSNSALGLRAAQNSAAANQQATAQTAVQGRMQEQLNAQQQLGNVIANQQGQDIGLATNQAGLQQQTALANQSAANQMNLSQAQLSQQNNQFNAGQGLNYAQLGVQQGEQNAQLQEQTNLANQQMQGQYGLQQGQFDQGTNVANLQAQMSQQQMNNQMVNSLYGQQANIYGNVGTQQLNLAQSMNGAQLANQAQLNAENQQTWNNAQQVTGEMMQAMAMSDENEKTNVKTVSDTSAQGLADSMAIVNAETAAVNAKPASSSSSSSGGMSSGSMSSMMKSFGGSGSSGDAGAADADIMSDENEKKDIEDDDEYQTQSFLDSLKAHTYEYKDKANGKGRFTGVMAQELEKTGIGKQAVVETPKGKMVDYARLASVMLAGQVMQNQQIKHLRMDVKELKNDS